MIKQERIRQDCNWIVKEAQAMREQVKVKLLKDVTDTVTRLDIKIRVKLMDYNELMDFIKNNK